MLLTGKYVESLKGPDHRGHATALLSYCWAYKITDVVRAVGVYCIESIKLFRRDTDVVRPAVLN